MKLYPAGGIGVDNLLDNFWPIRFYRVGYVQRTQCLMWVKWTRIVIFVDKVLQ